MRRRRRASGLGKVVRLVLLRVRRRVRRRLLMRHRVRVLRELLRIGLQRRLLWRVRRRWLLLLLLLLRIDRCLLLLVVLLLRIAWLRWPGRGRKPVALPGLIARPVLVILLLHVLRIAWLRRPRLLHVLLLHVLLCLGRPQYAYCVGGSEAMKA